MKRMLINATQSDEVRVAITDDTLLVDLDIEHPGVEQKKSNIYKGRITSIEPSLGAVFVDYSCERHGFLPLKEISQEYFLTAERIDTDTPDMNRLLKVGQELVVQVDKEERGTKGAALTTFISLAGSYLVLMPNNPRAGGISRRIEGGERDDLRDSISQLNIPEGMGIIVRTAGVGRNKEELEWDLSVLLQYWEAIKQAAILKPAPYLIHQESDVIIRAIRDYLRHDISEVIVDESTAFERARNYIKQVRPDFIDRVKLYSDHLPLFSRFQVERQIENAYKRELSLPAGGSIVIDHTEALVSIDINSARATKGGSIEETAHNTNLEAADEIARQLRIRDIGGLVVIDFIDMLQSRNQRDVENRLRNALRLDRARIQVGRISRFGLMEMSRQRIRAPLAKTIQVTCPRCDGRGSVRGVESLALSIIHLIQEQAARSPNVHLQVQLPVEVATYILNEKRLILDEIEKNSQIKVIVIPNQHLQSPQYFLKEVRDEHGKSISSYRLTKIPKPETTTARKTDFSKSAVQPAINEFLTTTTPPPPSPSSRKPAGGGVIKRLWGMMFSSETETAKKPIKKTHKKRQTQARKPTKGRKPAEKRTHHAKGSSRGRHQEGGRYREDNRDRSDDAKGRTRRGTRGGHRRSPNPSHAAPPAAPPAHAAPPAPPPIEENWQPAKAKGYAATQRGESKSAPQTRPAPQTKPAPQTRPAPQTKPAPQTRPAPQAKPAPKQEDATKVHKENTVKTEPAKAPDKKEATPTTVSNYKGLSQDTAKSEPLVQVKTKKS